MSAMKERRYTSGDGLGLFFRDWGEANGRTPLLCLPGLTRNCADFDDLARRHAAKRRVICPDYRGRGRSDYDPDWRRYQPLTYLEDLRHLLAAEGVGRVAVVGTSMGGLLAMGLAAALPGSVAAVVLNDVGPDLAAAGIGRILDYIGRDRPQPDWPAAVAELKRLLPSLSLRGDDKWLRFAKATYRQGGDGMLHFDWDINLAKPLAAKGAPVPDLWPMFRGLDMPVLALRGEVSDVLSEATFARMADELPQMQRLTVAGCGHCPALDEADAGPVVDAFLDGVP
jgi:pimeloyl-ACP methyl ester carboxylesterase